MQNYDLDNFEPAAKIVVVGVGGAGNNAVNRMIDEEINNVEFWVTNTDKQALSTSKAQHRLILGNDLTGGLGAGGNPEVGEKAAEASVEDIREIVKDANMVFVAAGMGGGTGTGAAPVVARCAREAGALVVAIVTRPFTFEGKRRVINSINGLTRLREQVDSIIVVSNDKLLVTSGNVPISQAFERSDGVLAQSVKTVIDLIMLPAVINLDFADVKSTLIDSGVGMIGFGSGRGQNRAKEAANNALNCPLLEASITGARRAIVSVTCGSDVSLFDAQECVNLLINASGHDIDLKFGVAINDQLSDEILVSVIASDFEEEVDFAKNAEASPFTFTKPKPQGETNIFGEESNPAPAETAPQQNPNNDINVSDDDILPNFLKD